MADMVLIGATPLRDHLQLTASPDALTERRDNGTPLWLQCQREKYFGGRDDIWRLHIESHKNKNCKSRVKSLDFILNRVPPSENGK